MVKIKVSEATPIQLGWLVAECENKLWLAYENALNNESPLPVRPSEFLRDNGWSMRFSPATNWAQGGPIIERESMTVGFIGAKWSACMSKGQNVQFGPTPLIAAMRCYVVSKLGDEVEVPGGLN